MKARNLTALAVVVTGAVAVGAPSAFAAAPDVSGVDSGLAKLAKVGKVAKKNARASKSKSQQRVDNDIKRLGENVASLRKQDDTINWTISSLVSTITPILTQLGAAATSYANFEYGVVQLYDGAPSASTVIAGGFVATPRIDPTVEQSTVTAQFPCLPTASTLGHCDAGDILHANVAVRSANPTANDAASTVKCRLQASQQQGSSPAYALSITGSGASATPFIDIARSALVPTDATEKTQFPAAMVSTDQTVDLLDSSRSKGAVGAGAPGNGGFSLSPSVTATGGMVSVTLSCLSVPKS